MKRQKNLFQFLLGKVRQQHFRCFQILLNQIFLIFATILSKSRSIVFLRFLIFLEFQPFCGTHDFSHETDRLFAMEHKLPR